MTLLLQNYWKQLETGGRSQKGDAPMILDEGGLGGLVVYMLLNCSTKYTPLVFLSVMSPILSFEQSVGIEGLGRYQNSDLGR